MYKKVFFLLFIQFCFSQDGTLNKIIRAAEKKTKTSIELKATVSFFKQKEWDSTLVYGSKGVVASNDEDVLNFCYFFRAYSFIEKNMIYASEKEFKEITTDFEYDYFSSMLLGEIYLQQHKFKKALAVFNDVVLVGSKKDIILENLNKVKNNIGLAYFHLKEYKKAKPYLKNNLLVQETIKDTLGIIAANYNLGNLYYEQYRDNLAIPYFRKAYELSKTVKEFQTKHDAALNMAVVEENRKNYKKALTYRKEAEQWKDSLNNQSKIYEVAQLEKQFAVKQKQQEVDLLHVENKAKEVERNGLLYSALTLLILLGVTFYFYKEKNKTHKIIVAQKETLDALNATKDKLFSIVSHDLRSSVNALKTSNAKLLSNLEANNLDALDTLLQRNSGIVNGAYNLLDNLLHWALLQTKQSYFYIEPLRLFFITEQVSHNYKPLLEDQGLTFENNVLKTVKVLADQESLKIILRNLLDNAIKFSKPNGQIKIYTTVNGDFCNLIVEDTGLGMSAATIATLLQDTPNLAKKENEDIIGTGLGVQLCKSYIQKNNGVFSIESTLGKGTKMIVSLPKTT
jgi:signal transduction histidine kinase